MRLRVGRGWRFTLSRVHTLAGVIVLLASCADSKFAILANSDPARVVSIRRLTIVARLDPAGAHGSSIQDQMPQMLRSCGIDTTLDVRNIAPILSSSLVEPPPGVRADAILIVDKVNHPIDPNRQPSYALRLRRTDGPTIWRATAERDPALGTSRTDPSAALTAALINRMVADGVLPGSCRQASA